MKKNGFIIFIIFLFVLLFIGLIYYFYTNSNPNNNGIENNYEAKRTSTENKERK